MSRKKSSRKAMKRYQFPQDFPSDYPKPGTDGRMSNEALVLYLLQNAKSVMPLGDGGDGMWRGIVEVGPEAACKFLDGPNSGNRKLRLPALRLLIADMRAGKFLNATHDAIVVDWHGMVVNGQHRLVAINESGVTVTLEIHIGVDPKTNLHIDQGSRRTIPDGLHYEKVECSFGYGKAVARSRAYDTVGREIKTVGSNGEQTRVVGERVPLMEMVNSAVTQLNGNGTPLPDCEQPCRFSGSHAAFMLGFELFPGLVPKIAHILGSGEYTQNSQYGMFQQYIISTSGGKTKAGCVQMQESFAAAVGLFCCVANNSVPATRAGIKATESQLEKFRAGEALPRKKNDIDYSPKSDQDEQDELLTVEE